MAESTTETITKYSPYVEAAHNKLLSRVDSDTTGAKNDNPYNWIINNREISPHPLFSTQSLKNTYSAMPALFNSWNSHIKDFNITTLWSTLFDDTTDNTAVRNLVAAERSMLEDAIDQDAVPRFTVGMRDINAVNSSSFIIGRALLEDTKEKEIAKFSAELKYRLLGIVIDRYKTHLSWKSGIVGTQMDAIKMFLAAEYQFSMFWNQTKAAQRRWRSDMNEYYRTAIAALQGAQHTTSSSQYPDPVSGSSVPTTTSGYNTGPTTQSQPAGSPIGGALSGAATGAMIGTAIAPGIGTLIGAVGGALFGGLF
jgi:hypothetical protein